MNAYERETVVNASDGDSVVTIWTAQRRYITKLRKHPRVEEVSTGTYQGTEWADFRVPADQWNPVTGVKRASSEAQRENGRRLHAAAEARRLAALRSQESSETHVA